MPVPSVMTHRFSEVPRADIARASFDRSHGNKSTFDAGYLIPIFVDEALPGDTFNLQMTAFARLATPLHPYMDNVFLDTFFFAVPYRRQWMPPLQPGTWRVHSPTTWASPQRSLISRTIHCIIGPITSYLIPGSETRIYKTLSS